MDLVDKLSSERSNGLTINLFRVIVSELGTIPSSEYKKNPLLLMGCYLRPLFGGFEFVSSN